LLDLITDYFPLYLATHPTKPPVAPKLSLSTFFRMPLLYFVLLPLQLAKYLLAVRTIFGHKPSLLTAKVNCMLVCLLAFCVNKKATTTTNHSTYPTYSYLPIPTYSYNQSTSTIIILFELNCSCIQVIAVAIYLFYLLVSKWCHNNNMHTSVWPKITSIELSFIRYCARVPQQLVYTLCTQLL
jgi:hypothetical protein